MIIAQFFTYIKIRRKLSLAQESTNGLGTNMGLHDTVQSNTEGIKRKKKGIKITHPDSLHAGAAFFIHHPPVSKHTTAIKNLVSSYIIKFTFYY